MAATDPLARLVSCLESSAVMYLADSGLTTYPGPDEVRRVLAELASAHKAALARAADVLADREVAVARTGYPLSFTGWHDADLGAMLPRLIEGLRGQLRDLEGLTATPDDAAARGIAADAATATRRHVDRLADLATRHRAGLAGQPA